MALTGAPERWMAPIACKLSCRRRKVVQCHRLQEDANGQTVSRRSVLSEGLLMRTVLMTWYHGRESIISTLRRTTVYDYVHAFSPKPWGVTPRQLSITSSKHPDCQLSTLTTTPVLHGKLLLTGVTLFRAPTSGRHSRCSH